MPSCVIKYCKNNSKRNKKDTGITYHRFPGVKIIADRWTTVIRLSRQDSSWTPAKQSVVCSAHFNDSDFTVSKAGLKRLSLGAVPQNLLFLSSAPPSNNISKDNLVKAEQSTSPVVEGNNKATDDEQYILSDLPESESTVNWSNNFWLRRELRKKAAIQLKHSRIIKMLRERNRRLKEANSRLKNIINSLKPRPGHQTVTDTALEAPSSVAHLATAMLGDGSTTLLGDDSTAPALDSDVFKMPLYNIIPDSKTTVADTAVEAPSSVAHLATTMLGDDSTTLLGVDSTAPASDSDVFKMPLYNIIPDSKTKIKDKNFKLLRSTLNSCESYKYTF